MGIKRLLLKRMLKTWEEHDCKILAGQSLPDEITGIFDIPYINDGNKGHFLDIYYPANTVEKLPVIIDIHGGGFVYGDKELNKAFCYHLARRGFIVFNLNYRLALKDTKVLGQIQDVMEAIHWITNNIEVYPANKEQSFIVGDSAGGVLAVMAVLIAQNERLQKLFNAKKTAINFKAISIICGMMNFHMDGLKYWGLRSVCFNRGYKRKEYYKNMIFNDIPEMKGLPPVFLTTSEEDELSFMTLDFEKILKKYDVKYQMKYFKRKDGRQLGHIFGIQYPEYDESKELFDEMIGFFQTAAGINSYFPSYTLST